jgi:hypothetical protein
LLHAGRRTERAETQCVRPHPLVEIRRYFQAWA